METWKPLSSSPPAPSKSQESGPSGAPWAQAGGDRGSTGTAKLDTVIKFMN